VWKMPAEALPRLRLSPSPADTAVGDGGGSELPSMTRKEDYQPPPGSGKGDFGGDMHLCMVFRT